MPGRINPKILAIDPGTREMGVAVLLGNELEYYGVKTITRRTSPSSILTQGRQIVRKLIKLHSPIILAVERPFLGYGNRSSVLVALSKEIKQVGRQEGLPVVEIHPKTAKKLIGGNGSTTKRDIARILVARFPELKIYLGQTHRYKEKYWQNMFDAVAIALAVVDRSC